MLEKIQRALPIATLSLLYLILALSYGIIVPLWESPDEPAHFSYIVHLLREHTLPRMEMGRLDEAHQPPLYYVLAAVVATPADLDDPTGMFRLNPRFVYAGQGGRDVNWGLHDESEVRFPFKGWSLALHLTRAFSSLLGLGTVLFTYSIARRVFPDSAAIPFLAATLVGLNPQFLFISASANNDNLVTFATTGLLWYTIGLLGGEDRGSVTARDGLILGAWILAILMTKLSSLAIIGVAVIAVLIAEWRNHQLKPAIRGLVLAGLVTVVGSFWWFLRNQALYGDPLGLSTFNRVFQVLVRTEPLPAAEYPAFFRTQFRSFWGIFGWMSVYAPEWYYSLFAWGCCVAVLGWLPRLFRRDLRPVEWRLLVLMLIGVLVQEAYTILLAQQANESRWQGRYLFPAVAPLAVLLGCGITGWGFGRWQRHLAWSTGLGMLVLAVLMLLGVVRPAYLQRPTLDQVSISHPQQVAFGDQFLLHGYDLDQESLAVTLTLYWEALRTPDFDYSVFVHLVDQTGDMIGQRDHAPGSDRNHPPTAWKPGEFLVDSHRIPLLRSPEGTLQMRIGVYNWATGERMMASVDGEPVGDAVVFEVGTSSRQPWVLLLTGTVLVVIGAAIYLLRSRRPAKES